MAFAGTREVRAEQIAFFYALDKDFTALKSESQSIPSPIKIGTRTIHRLHCGSNEVYAVKMGSGTVETATSVQALLTKFHCMMALSVGPVGSLAEHLTIGSWYRVSSIVAYQKGSWTTTGFQMSPAFTFDSPTNVNLFPSNLAFVNSLGASTNIRVASGEAFIASSTERNRIRELTGADAVDMNLFGLATVCEDHRIPLLCWRVVSDSANDTASEDFRRFVQNYDGIGGRVAAAWIRQVPANPNSPATYPNLKRLLSPRP